MKKALIGLVFALCLCTLPILHATAMPSPATNIRVWPVGGVGNGDPIATYSPADMQIYVTTAKHRISSAWILLVLNEETYNGLNYIEVNGVNYAQGDFAVVTESKIPPQAANGDYPGCEDPLQHQVDAVKDKLGTRGEVYYAIKKVFDYEISTSAVFFTITYNGSSADLKILVLAFGREVLTSFVRDTLTGEEPPCPFNNRSSFSGSTLMVVPELATILLATASLSVFGLYTLKRKNK